MLSSLTITSLYVLDQDQALDFYVGTLGLEVSNDLDFGPMRWLTVRVPGEQCRRHGTIMRLRRRGGKVGPTGVPAAPPSPSTSRHAS